MTSRARTTTVTYKKEGNRRSPARLATLKQLIISGDRAYVVLPTTFAVTQKGKRVGEIARSTLVSHKTAAGWRISAWT